MPPFAREKIMEGARTANKFEKTEIAILKRPAYSFSFVFGKIRKHWFEHAMSDTEDKRSDFTLVNFPFLAFRVATDFYEFYKQCF